MKKVSWKWKLVGCRKSGASRLPGTHSNLAIARYLSFQQSIRQPRRPHSRGPGSGAGARSFPFRCSVFVWPSSPSGLFFLAQFIAAGVARYACHQFIFFSPVYINENDTMCEKLSPVLVFLYVLIYDTIYVSHHVVLISLVLSFYILNLCKKDVITYALRKLCI